MQEQQFSQAAILKWLGKRSVVLVGLMGAGKTSVGRRLAERLHLPFVDADHEIEAAAGKSIADIFAENGEAYFRDGERRVIARLIETGPQVLATGGGAFMNEMTRQKIQDGGISIWLKADVDTLVRRVSKRNDRPLLIGKDPKQVLNTLIEQRYPIYAEAALSVVSQDLPQDQMVLRVIDALGAWLKAEAEVHESANATS